MAAHRVETPFLIVRIMRDGTMERLRHRLLSRPRHAPRTRARCSFRERIVVCDGGRFDTLVAIPF